eukprot:g29133.t1
MVSPPPIMIPHNQFLILLIRPKRLILSTALHNRPEEAKPRRLAENIQPIVARAPCLHNLASFLVKDPLHFLPGTRVDLNSCAIEAPVHEGRPSRLHRSLPLSLDNESRNRSRPQHSHSFAGSSPVRRQHANTNLGAPWSLVIIGSGDRVHLEVRNHITRLPPYHSVGSSRLPDEDEDEEEGEDEDDDEDEDEDEDEGGPCPDGDGSPSPTMEAPRFRSVPIALRHLQHPPPQSHDRQLTPAEPPAGIAVVSAEVSIDLRYVYRMALNPQTLTVPLVKAEH